MARRRDLGEVLHRAGATGRSAAFPWPRRASANNQYGVTLSARLNSGEEEPTPSAVVSRQQIVAAARFVKRTITVDGRLDDWRGVTPVAARQPAAEERDRPLAIPAQSASGPAGPARQPARIIARVYTAYDDAKVYVAAAVRSRPCNFPPARRPSKAAATTKGHAAVQERHARRP